jgi:hypothetical protein
VVLPQGIEECLVDCSTHKLLGKLIVGQHIAYRVRLSLVPKLVPGFDPIGDHKWCGFASIDNDIGIVRSGDRSDALSELAVKKSSQDLNPWYFAVRSQKTSLRMSM